MTMKYCLRNFVSQNTPGKMGMADCSIRACGQVMGNKKFSLMVVYTLWAPTFKCMYRGMSYAVIICQALMFKTYTTASDVWSYGILLYEMWSLGHKPYQDYDNTEVSADIC